MNSRHLFQVVEPWIGVAVLLFVSLDFFLTVLYSRVGSGILSPRIASWAWRLFSVVSAGSGKRRGKILSFCGPVVIVLIVAAWGAGLTLGTALIIHPQLGKAVLATDGPTPTDFVSAMFAGGSSLSIVGTGDFIPKTRAFRWFFFGNSLGGMSLMFLATTYVIQIYTALQNRNTLGLKLHLGCRQRGDAAEWVAGLGPCGQFDKGYNSLAEMAAELIHVKESHHFYPVVFYFRFSESFYSVSQFALIALDSVSLIKSALDEETFLWLKNSGAVAQLWDAATLLVNTLTTAFLPKLENTAGDFPDSKSVDRWHRRYDAAVQRLKNAGIQTRRDEREGAEQYVLLRLNWHQTVCRLAEFGGFDAEEIDPAGSGASHANA